MTLVNVCVECGAATSGYDRCGECFRRQGTKCHRCSRPIYGVRSYCLECYKKYTFRKCSTAECANSVSNGFSTCRSCNLRTCVVKECTFRVRTAGERCSLHSINKLDVLWDYVHKVSLEEGEDMFRRCLAEYS